MTQRIRKAVFPVAGMGTRFLPATKANPKEMLPVVDKPLIQYAAEEAVAAGIEHLIFITGRNKRSIPDHFDKAYELESELEQRGKTQMLEVVRNIVPDHVTCVYIRQSEALGLGHAVGCAEPVIGDEPFAVVLADDLIKSDGPNALQQMIEVYNETGASVLGVEEVPKEETYKYGVIKPKEQGDRLWEVAGMVEKPRPEEAPSNISVVGRYILTPAIFREIERIERGAGNEIQLTDAIVGLLEHEKVMAYRFSGERYDCGSKLGYLEATVEYALSHPELAEDFRAYLKSLHIC
jgi:UTP--glucose-1-phosphate uridylyltransferase